MRIDVNGTHLWFDVNGPGLVPDGEAMRERPTLILVHGGPGGFDHSYFKPDFAALTRVAQLVYLDLRDHGRSGRHDPAAWSFEACADDLRAFCDALGIVRPIVLGHSMGGFVVALYGARHPGHAGGLIFQSTLARFDLDRLVAGFRRVGGNEVAELARRDYSGDEVSDDEWAMVAASFGPNVPSAEVLARRVRNPAVGGPGMDLMRAYGIVDQLARITSPTLVCVGSLDPVTPMEASAEEITGALAPGVGRLEILDGAGHWPWLDMPERYFAVIAEFIAEVAGSSPAAHG